MKNDPIQVLRHQPFYDSCDFDRHMSFFDESIGVRGKTYAQTNMCASRVLPHPQRFRIEQLRFDVSGSDHFRENVKERGYLELIIGNRYWLQIAPLGLLMPEVRHRLEPAFPITHVFFDYDTPIYVNVRSDMTPCANRAFVHLIGQLQRPEL